MRRGRKAQGPRGSLGARPGAREREGAALIARGLSNRLIAQGLYLSERTIEHHVSKILRKLDLASRTEIAAWANQKRLLTPEPD